MQSYTYNLGQAFSLQAAKTPKNIAIRTLNNKEINYIKLDNLSNRIANFLINKKLNQGDVVGIIHDKSITAYACMIACLKSGFVYANLDPKSPEQRLSKIIVSCHPKIILTYTSGIKKILKNPKKNNLIINYSLAPFLKEIKKYSSKTPLRNQKVSGNDAAYIMFTSGSTGFPKGATISHLNLLNFIAWSIETFKIKKNDRLSGLNPLHFDNSVFDFFASLFSGSCLIPIPDELCKTPALLIKKIDIEQVTIWFSVPSLIIYCLKMRALNSSNLKKLRILSFGGEGFPKSQLRAIAKLYLHRIKFVNVYGPTECTCICSSYDVKVNDLQSDELVSLGEISKNFKYLILNEDNMPVPIGKIGELCLGGPMVGHGYYKNQEQTSFSFIQNPVKNEYRDVFYKTGDLVKENIQKRLFFCGRKDNQIKRMGYRIELEEIEAALGSLHYVDESAVLFVKKNDDIGIIKAYISSQKCEKDKIYADLRKKIPAYMVPDEILFCSVLPKNRNGKIDRKQLVRQIK